MSFSLNRFWQFVKADVTENKVTYLAVLIGSFVAMILLALLFSNMAWSFAGEDLMKSTFNGFSLFIIELTICLAFWDIPNKGKFISLVQKPASMLEKYIARVIFFVFLFPALQRVFFIIVEFGRMLFLPRFEGDWFMSIYGRAEGESFWQYYMGIDQILFISLICGWASIALVIYFSSTYGGLKSFLRCIAASIFGLIALVVVLMSKAYNMNGSLEINVDTTSAHQLCVALVVASGVLFAASALCVRSFVLRNLRIYPLYRHTVAIVSTIAVLCVEMLVYSYMLDLLHARSNETAVVLMCCVSSVNLLFLIYGSYRNFSHRQLCD